MDRSSKKEPSVKIADLSLLSVPAFWPMAMLHKGTEPYAKILDALDSAAEIHDGRSTLATPNRARLNLRTMVLRDYGRPGGIPTLVDAPPPGIPP